jgi:cytochrome c oxidase assembly protein subunit 15
MFGIPDLKNLVSIPFHRHRLVLFLRPALRMLTTHLVIALVALVVIGGATRVMEAGLACPDWPLCYGALLPGRQMNMQVFLEWFHRLDAFLVGLALLSLLALSLWGRRRLPSWIPWVCALAVGLVGVQGILGALTVTGLLASSTVTAHLATALVLVLLISGLDQGLAEEGPFAPIPSWWLPLPVVSTGLVLIQCIVGASMASQWAVDQCFASGELCEWVLRHRQLAGAASFSVGALAVGALLLIRTDLPIRALAVSAAALVALQITLGVLTLRAQLQLPVLTMAHQLVAALLVAHLGALCGRSLRAWRPASSPMEVRCG